MNRPWLEAAARLGRRICRDAIWSDDRCSWIGDAMEAVDGQWMVVHRALGPELYNGTAGIALVLARLYQQRPEPVFRATALAALRCAADGAAAIPPALRCSLYSGTLGIATVQTLAARIFAKEGLSGQARALLEDLPGDPGSGGLDIVSGSAGAIAGLLGLEAQHSGLDLRSRAVAHGEHLLAQARWAHGCCSWDTLGGQAMRDLTGFSHGAGGIAWALLELGQRCGRSDFLAAAQGGIAYERRWFSAAHGNWPDFRTGQPGQPAPEGGSFGVAWCHGAPGIGIARQRVFELTGEDAARQEALAALRTTAAFIGQVLPTRFDCSPCHGLAGDLEVLIEASALPGQAAQLDQARTLTQALLALHQDSDWPCGVPGGGETPGLMLGLAGIAYLLLRLEDPRRLPSLLLPIALPV